MLVKVTILALAASSFVSATKTITCSPPKPTPEPASQCNTGHAQCCNTVNKASDSAAAALLGVLGVVVEPVEALVGLGCSVLGSNCEQQALCCENNRFNGLISFGCTQISL